MSNTNVLTQYVGNFVDELAYQGVQHVVISPGSRSTPLAVLFVEHAKIKEWILVDERSAAFFALGLARKTNKPVVLVCTSGTAAANYFPAIIEAYTQRIPLIILTSDRPHELRDVGAPQTMNQIGMYGNFVKWFQEMALPENNQEMLDYVRSRAARAMIEAVKVGNPGPVHLNFPFREPLMPNVHLENIWGQQTKDMYQINHGKKQISEADITSIAQFLQNNKRGVIVCGPQFDVSLADSVVKLSQQLQVPILADPLSQLRSGSHSKETIIEGYDALLKSETERKLLKPDYIIRFGAMPISKSYLHYTNEFDDIKHFVIEDVEGVREPTNQTSHYIWAYGPTFCEQLTEQLSQITSTDWLRLWKNKNDIVKSHLMKSENQLTEGEAVRHLIEHIPNESVLFVGNSMPVRDLDTFFMTSDKSIEVFGNRGVSGIEGITSTALGLAAADINKRVTLVIGDLSFYHDFTGLLAAKKYELNLTIVLINNNGGGIFSFLPQAKEKTNFESLFGTPLDLDFSHMVNMYEGSYCLVKSEDKFVTVLEQSYTSSGLHVIEVQTDREENVEWHRNLWKKIHKELQQ